MKHTLSKVLAAAAITVIALAPLPGFAQTTSQTHEGLKQLLQRYPDADLDRDHVLTMDEAREFRMRMWQEETETGTPIERDEPGGEIQAPAGAGDPTLLQMPYGELPGQYFDLWLPRNATPPCPTVFLLNAENEDAEPPQRLLKDSLNVGISVGLLHGRAEGNGETYFEDIAQALRFLRERGHSHGVRPDRMGLFGQGASAEHVLYGALLAPAEEENTTGIRCAAVLDPEPRAAAEGRLTPEDCLVNAYPKVHALLGERHGAPAVALLHTGRNEGDVLVQALRLQNIDAALNNAAENERDAHLMRKAALFYSEKLRKHAGTATPPAEKAKE